MLSRRSLLRAGGGLTLAAAAAGAGSWAAAGTTNQWDKLRSQLQGDLVLPSDSGYELAKQGQFIQYDSINPVAIAYCETPEDVRACVLHAQRQGIPVRVRSGGHNLNGWSTGEGLVIDLSRINHATVGSSTVRVGPGTQSVDALRLLKPYDKQIITGTCPTVCAGGFVTGGGLGFQTRKFGTASDRVAAVRVVLADGRIVRACSSNEPDLYWAVRGGGGGNLGVVVDFEVRPIDAPRIATYDTTWSWEHGPTVFSAWQEWTAAASRNLGSSLFLEPPAAVGGSAPVIRVYGGYHGPKAELDGALAELTQRVGAQPVTTTSAESAFSDGMRVLYGCGEMTVAECHRSGSQEGAKLYRTPFQRQSYQLSDRVLSVSEAGDLLAAYDSRKDAIPFRFMQVFALGGALRDTSPSATAFVHRDARFLVGYQSFDLTPTPSPDVVAEHTAWTDNAATALAPISSGSYINFPSSRLNQDWGTSNYGANYPRLREVQRAYDPNGFFKHPGSIAG